MANVGQNGERLRPPYASVSDIRRTLDKIRTMAPPPMVDAKWVTTYGLAKAQASAIVNLLRWLGLIGADGTPNVAAWKRFRTDKVALGDLIRESYAGVFEAVDIETVDRSMLEAAFIDKYDTGSTERPLAAFMELCALAEVPVAAASTSTRRATSAGQKSSSGGSGMSSSTSSAATARAETRRAEIKSNPAAVNITVALIIPPEWDEARIAARVKAVIAATADA